MAANRADVIRWTAAAVNQAVVDAKPPARASLIHTTNRWCCRVLRKGRLLGHKCQFQTRANSRNTG